MSEKLNPEEKKILIGWGIFGIIIFLLVLSYKFFYLNPLNKDNETYEYKIVSDYNRYYTVIGAINKFYSFYNAGTYDSILHILNNDYKTNNNITIDNIEKLYTKPDNLLAFNGYIMCSKKLDEGITSYLVEGNETLMNTGEVISKKYYNVYLDGNELVFSIEPIDEEFFGGNCNGKL